VHLDAIVVEAGGRVADLEPQRLQLERVMAEQVATQAAERDLGALAAAAHLAQPGDADIGVDLHDGADETSPMRPGGVPQRRLERHGDRGGAQVGDLRPSHRPAPV